MKLYTLKSDGVLVAVSNDKWLLELFLVQRGYILERCEISRCFDKDQAISDLFLVYYFGYPITSHELSYINRMEEEYRSSIDEEIFRLEKILDRFDYKLSKKDRKNIKKTIKALKKIDTSDDIGFANRMIGDIINQPASVMEYLENLELFKSCMEES